MAQAWEGALEAGLSVVVGVVLGYYADRWLGTEPIFLFIFMVLGGVAGVRRLLRIPVASASHEPAEGGARGGAASSGREDREDPRERTEQGSDRAGPA
jgi:F0F1-type ATP synthase assembly protein I